MTTTTGQSQLTGPPAHGGAIRVPPGRDDDDAMTRRRWAMLIGTWLGAAMLLIVLQWGRKTPTVFVDELVYGRLAQNIGLGEGRTYQGLPTSLNTVYPYVIAPAWSLFSGELAYRVALVINALVMTSAVLPTFALARRVAAFRWALATGALAAVVPSMVWAGMLMTEALAYPVAAAALLAMVKALERPSWRVLGLVAALVAVAYLVRHQFIGLAAVFLGAVLLDVARQGIRAIPGRARLHRLTLGAAAVGGAGLLGAIVFGRTAFGGLACVVNDPPSLAEVAGPMVDYGGILLVATLGAPLIALATLALRRANWRAPDTGPLLCVGLAAVAVLVLQAAWMAVTVSPELQERYVFYAAPVLLPAIVALPGRAAARTAALLGAATVAYFVLWFPGFGDVTGEVVADRLALSGTLRDIMAADALLWGAAAVVFASAVVAAASGRSPRGVAMALSLTALFGIAVLGVRQLDANRQSAELAARYQQPLDVVDRTVREGGSAAVLMLEDSPGTPMFHLQLWNQSIDRTYRLGIGEAFGVGQLCPLEVVGLAKYVVLREPCAGRRQLPSTIVAIDGRARLPFANATTAYEKDGLRVLSFPTSQRPRIGEPGSGKPNVPLNLDTPPDAPVAPVAGRCNQS